MESYTITPIPAVTKQATRAAYHTPAYSHYTPSDELKNKVLSAGHKQYPNLYELIKDCERGRSKFINPAKKPEQPPPEGQVWLYDSVNNEWFTRNKKPVLQQKEARKADEAALPTPPLTPPCARQAAAATLTNNSSDSNTATNINHSGKKIIRRRQPNPLFFKPTHMGLHRDNNNCMAGKRPEGFHQVVGQRAKEAMAVVHKDQLRISGRGAMTKVMTRQFRVHELYETTAAKEGNKGPGMKEKLEEEIRKVKMAAADPAEDKE
ncbi:hypothetical protein DV737_g4541, partial [Chaetothyriales sp. CBS 132003]